MKLLIENLGVIKQAKIDLTKKFILFCGRNSTGKTYASYVLQAFLYDNSVFSLKCFKEIAQQIKSKGFFEIKQEYIQEWVEQTCHAVVGQTGGIFGISDETSRRLFKKFSLSAEYSDDDFAHSLKTTIDGGMKEVNSFWKISKKREENLVRIESNVDNSDWANIGNIRFESLICRILRHLAFGRLAGVRMLTVERNSIYTFKTELSLSRNELIDRIQQQSDHSEIDILDLLNSSSRRYPQAVRSSLRIANDLENVQKHESQYSEIANAIEQNLLKGEVSMTKNGDVEFHSQNMAKTMRLPFHLSSSIVKTMASLVIYLRHIAQSGDTLIIDEPEMNFHPDVQVLLARIFTLLASHGLQIIVSTHSDYIIRELNNLIMAEALLKKGDNKTVNDLGYQAGMPIDFKDVSVLFFENSGKKTVKVTPIDVDEDGFSVKSIDQTITKQNDSALMLYDALHE